LGQHSNRTLGDRFWRLWAATGISSLGDGMVLVGFPLLALSFTHRAVLIAGVAVAGQLPSLLLALPIGALADRVNRRRMVLAIEILRFFVLAAFTTVVVAGADGLVAIYVTVFVLGTLTFAFEVAATACLPTIVKLDRLVPANAHLMTVELTGKEMVGQAIGGAAFALATVLPFAVDSCSFVASAGLLRRTVPDNLPANSETTLRTDLRAGLRWFWSTPLLRMLAGLIASLAFCQALVLGVLVLYGTQNLHLSRAGYGLLLGVAALGTAVGAVSASQLHARLGSGWCIVLAGLAAAAAYPILAMTRSAVVAAAALALESLGVMIGNVASRSLRQAIVPQEMQGRAASAYQMVLLGAVPLGGLVGGLLTAQFGIRATFVLAGCLQLSVLAVAAPRLVAYLRQHPLDPPKPSLPVAAAI
jgi:MFS family permease